MGEYSITRVRRGPITQTQIKEARDFFKKIDNKKVKQKRLAKLGWGL